jgi:hypothetical protein
VQKVVKAHLRLRRARERQVVRASGFTNRQGQRRIVISQLNNNCKLAAGIFSADATTELTFVPGELRTRAIENLGQLPCSCLLGFVSLTLLSVNSLYFFTLAVSIAVCAPRSFELSVVNHESPLSRTNAWFAYLHALSYLAGMSGVMAAYWMLRGLPNIHCIQYQLVDCAFDYQLNLLA